MFYIGIVAAVCLASYVTWRLYLHLAHPKANTRQMLENRLAEIMEQQTLVLKYQAIVTQPDAYEILILQGYPWCEGYDYMRFDPSPDAMRVREYIAVNTTDGNTIHRPERVDLRRMHAILKKREGRTRDDLYALDLRAKPTSDQRKLRLIEQQAKVDKLAHELAAERELLERLTLQSLPPDPYGRSPKMRVEAPTDETDDVEETSARKKRA